MGLLGRLSGVLVISFLSAMALPSQNPPHDQDLLTNISTGKTRVLDLTYAINDKLVPWPGDEQILRSQR